MDTNPPSDANVNFSLQGMLNDLRSLIEQLMNNMDAPAGQLSFAQIKTAIGDLQRVDEKDIIDLGYNDSLCPICLTPYDVILSEEEMALAMDSPAHPIEESGIAKLAQPWQCGHIFCRKDIIKWITSGHDSCPMCRRRFLQQQGSLQTAEELARAEESAQAVDRQLREVGRYLRGSNPILTVTDGVFEATHHNESTRDDNVEDDREEPAQNSGMYS
ncbi:hypothetical protein BYT27DRAFT_6417539 [Phlegmacium glaucopus]|nr:hypothetical protein BYT27DRAFT_6417539 [Phlegmacium glaucopus]